MLSTRKAVRRRQVPRKLGGAELLEERRLLTTFVVNTRYDVVDEADGLTSLREALNAANDETSHPGHDRIVFDSSLEFATISRDFQGLNENGDLILPENCVAPDSQPFQITSDLTIDGSTAQLVRIGRDRGALGTRDGRNFGYCYGRIFDIAPTANAELINVVVQGGDVREDDGGGIKNEGILTLRNSVVGSNVVRAASGTFRGGGIYNTTNAELTLVNSHIGEILLSDEFLAEIGVDGASYQADEVAERTLYTTFVVTVPDHLRDNDTNEPTRISGNIAVGMGAGIYNEGILRITEASVVEGNRALAQGGGIYNDVTGTVEIVDSTIKGHTIWSNGFSPGGLIGGGIFNAGELSLLRSVMEKNYAYQGGGIYNTGTLAIHESTLSNNQSAGGDRGGAIFDRGTSTSITNSTLSGNLAGLGAGIYNESNPSLVIENSTIASNGTGTVGHGLWNNGTITLRSSTVAGNAIGIFSRGTLVLSNTIIADSVSAFDLQSVSPAVLTSLGGNLIGRSAGNNFPSTALASDLVDVDAKLGELRDNGGATMTVALRPGSPAIDSAVATALTTDQRGEPRFVGTAADRGAFEFRGPRSMRVDTLDGVADGYFNDGEMSLADAVEWANALPGPDTIALSREFVNELRAQASTDSAFSAMIRLAETLLITDDLTIYGPGAELLSVSGNDQLRVFEIAAGVKVTLAGMAIRDGYATGVGGGILNQGNLTLREVYLTENEIALDAGTEGHGGGIYNMATGTLHVESSTIAGNIAADAGAGLYLRGTATIVNSTITGNHGQRGAGIYNIESNTEIINSTIVQNTSSVHGGGVRTWNAVLTVGNSIIATNQSPLGPDLYSNHGATSLGHNLIGIDLVSETAGAFPGFEASGDMVGTSAAPIDPVLGVLRRLGSGTPVHGLLPTSPAIDAAAAAIAPARDQRGVPRPVGALPDIGAFEYETPTLPNPLVIDSLLGFSDGYYAPGELSLTEAILFANDDVHYPAIDTIHFDEALFLDANGEGPLQAVIDISSSPLNITSELNLVGPGAEKLKIIGDRGALFSSSLVTVRPFASMTLTDVTIGEHARGITNQGTLTLDGVYLLGNSQDGIINSGDLSISNSTIAQNELSGVANHGQAVLTNVTISGNGTNNNLGGGGVRNLGPLAELELRHVTVASNQSVLGGGFYNGEGATIRFGNSIIAGNQTFSTGPDGYNEGAMITLGGNLIGTNYDLFLVPLPSDRILATGLNGDVSYETFLGRLQNVSEHAIPVHPVLPNSPAKDLGISANAVATDQRGVSRPQLAAVDAGAFELQDYSWDREIVVDSFTDELDGEYGPGQMTLREALLWSNFKDGDGVANGEPDVITFDPVLIQSLADGALGTNTLVLEGATALCNPDQWVPQCGPEPQLVIEQDLKIVDPGSLLAEPVSGAEIFRISGNGSNRVLEIAAGATVELTGLTIADGYSNTEDGGGIYHRGESLTLRNVVIENNTSRARAGGIYHGGNDLVIEASTLRNNSSRGDGGAILSDVVSHLSIIDSTFYDNHAGDSALGNAIGSGGAVFAGGPTTIEGSAFYHNVARNNGGAIATGTVLVQIANSTISANSSAGSPLGSTQNGGGIYALNLQLNHVTVANNTAPGRGGGIRSEGLLEIYNSIVADNTSVSTAANEDDVDFAAGSFNSQFTLYGVLPNVAIGTNLVGDPQLGPLGDNGGPTWTHAINPTSPAVDAGDLYGAPSSFTGTRLTDQRGKTIAKSSLTVSGTEFGSFVRLDDDAITMPNSVFTGLNSFMVEFRFRTSRTGTQTILSVANAARSNEFAIYYLNATAIRVIDQDDNVLDFTGLPNLADGQWHHIAVARDYIRDQTYLVIDGVFRGKRLNSIGVTTISSTATVLGQDQDTPGGAYNSTQAAVGDLDEFRVWQGFWPLTSETQEQNLIVAHVQQYLDGPLAGEEASLKTYYDFEERNGATVLDRTPNARHATLGDNVGSTAANVRPAPERVQLGRLADLGAYEVQKTSSSVWRYEALGNSQFGPGDALVYGFGFDDGRVGSSVNKKPYFLGFQFDTGPRTFGGIETGPFDTRFGGQVKVDLSGKLGFNLGFYVNSGSVDVTYDGAVNYLIDTKGENTASISAFVDVQDGGLYTISPKIGAYADLVLKLDADVSATGCLFGCVSADLLDIHFNHTEEMFALNRQLKDDSGRPVFFNHDDNDVPISRDIKTGVFYDMDGVPLADQNISNFTPYFDGDIRYFSLPIQDIVNGVTTAAKTIKEKLADRKAVREVSDAERAQNAASDRVNQLNDELDKAKKQLRNPAGGTAAEVIQARDTITRLAGKEYADAVAAGTDAQSVKKGRIQEAEDAVVAAHNRTKDAKAKFEKRQDENKAKQKMRSPKSFVGLAVGEADGSLLGAQIDLEAGVTAGPFNVSKNLGSLQVTLPDVNLRDTTTGTGGVLKASTDAFAPNSELDAKRQIAKAQVDLASLLPVFPGGKYNISAGPLSLDVTTVSYNIGPQLNVVQDVSATPIANRMTYNFVDPVTESATCVNVLINGLSPAAGDVVTCPSGGVSQVAFDQGAKLDVSTEGLANDGQVVRVDPMMGIEARFSNDIGLEVDLDGVFEAFAVSLSAFGASIIDVGPLIRHAHTLVDRDLGSVFERTFDLNEQHVPLASFLLFDQMNDGVTADTAYSTSQTATENVAEITGVIVPPETSVWFSSEMINPASEMEFFSELDVQVTGTAVVESLQMIDPALVVTSAGVGQFHITGFTPQMLNERSTALFALSFSSGGEATVRTTRSAPMTLSSNPSETENTGSISADDLELAGVTATISLDIDQDGVATPLTDGILLMRYLEGMRGEDLVRGAVNLPAIVAHDRTGRTAAEIEAQLPDDIVAYIENVLIKSFLTDSADPSSIRNTLDLDNSGGTPDINDGELLARYMAGFTSGSLTNGLSSADPASVLSFIETGRISARDINLAAFGEIISETGEDVLGLEGVGRADNSDGSSASGAVDPMVLAGASPEFAMDGNLVMAGGLPSAYEYFLDQYGQMTMFEEVYLDGELISRVAEGSPLDFGSDQYAALINAGNSGELTKVTGSAELGTEEPIFVRSPDAVGYEYEALSDHLFTRLVIDPQVGGNLLLPSEFDLYLLQNGKWEFVTTITGQDPAYVGTNGFLTYAFPNGPVSAFRLYSHALPNFELHSQQNDVADELDAELMTTTGLLLQEGGAAAVPHVRMKPLADRQLFRTPDPLFVPEVNLAAIDPSYEIRLTRSGADLRPSLDGAIQTSFQMASAVKFEIFGGDSSSDVLLVDSAGGPRHVPIVFDAGFRDDEVVIDAVDGAGLLIDLVERDTFYGVEAIDVRGSGANQLRLDLEAVLANDPFTRQLIVRADSDDVVDLGTGWTLAGQQVMGAETFDRYVQGAATVYVLDTTAQLASVGKTEAEFHAVRRTPRAALPPSENGAAQAQREELVIAAIEDRPSVPAQEIAMGPLPADRSGPRQIVSSVVDSSYLQPGDAVSLTVSYEADTTETQTTTPGLHLRIHYDSSKLWVDLVEIEKLASFRALQDVEDGPCSQGACIGLDGDPRTDRYVNVLWLDIYGAWSSEAAELLTASLIARADATEMTTIRFTGVAAAGYQLVTRSLNVTFEEGDVTVDGRVDASDIDAISRAILMGSDDPRLDLNRDQVVNDADRLFLIEEVLKTWEGDANLDRQVDELDFAVWDTHRFESDTSWSDGDFDGDGKTDVRDFLLWNSNKRRTPVA